MERVEMALMAFKSGLEELLFTFNNGRRFLLDNNGLLCEWDKKKEKWDTLREGDAQNQSLSKSEKEGDE